MALTPFGKALRKLRIDRDMLLKDMAKQASMTPAFLSAVEAGRKAIPPYLVDRIAKSNNLGESEKRQLSIAADMSAQFAQIDLSRMTSDFDKSLAVQLARNFDTLDDVRKLAIKDIMDRRKA
ncbi:MAG: helix-turn-helix transcriptional regulator [Acetobacteraceae bacterium]|jgi:transcriptional regulator with XRE-family HTH domain